MKLRLSLLFFVSLATLFAASLGALAAAPAPVAPLAPTALHMLADFEGAMPAGYFAYNGGVSSVATSLQSLADSDPRALPGQVGANGVLSVTFNVGDYGGFGADFAPNPQDWSSYDGLAFWFYGSNSGLAYQAEIMDNRSDPNSDTAERFDYTFVDDFTGWRHISVPFSAFSRATDFQPGGAPNDGLTLNEMWGFAFPLPFGSSDFFLDQVALYNLTALADFEGAMPAGYFAYNGGASSVATSLQSLADSDPRALPGQVGAAGVLSVTFNVGDYGGFGADFAPNPQDWSGYDGLSFWFYGSNSGLAYQAEIMDNRSDPNSDTAERFDYTFVDDFTGWRHISVPFSAFSRATDFQPGGAPNDGLTLNEMWGFAFPLPFGSSDFFLDQVALMGAGAAPFTVGFEQFAYSVAEGDMALVDVSLSVTATQPVSVAYSTADGSATSADYTPTSGVLLFPAGSRTQSFSVPTTQDSDEEADETILLTLSAPSGVALGARDQVTLTILDDDAVAPTGLSVVIDDFESGLPSGVDANGVGIGFVTWHDPSSSVAITLTDAPPAPRPGSTAGNTVLQWDSTIASWGGFSHAFEDATVSQWVSQDWSGYEGFAFWLYGTGSGTGLFVDILENRNPGSTTDDAERFSYGFADDVAGWRLVTIPFSEFTRKEIGNGAPNDGFDLTEVHGWALGSLNSPAEQRFVDDVGLLVRSTMIDDFESGLPSGVDANGVGIGFVTWHDPSSSVAITLTDAPPAPRPGSTAGNTVLQWDSTIASWGGFSHAFEDATVSQWVSQDWSGYEGFAFWLYGTGSGTGLFVDILENRNPGSTTDDAERFSYGFADDVAGWRLVTIPFSEFARKEIGNGAPNDGFDLTEVHGWALGSLNSPAEQRFVDDVVIYGSTGSDAPLEVEFSPGSYSVTEGTSATITVTLSRVATQTVTVAYQTGEGQLIAERDYMPVSGTLSFAVGETEKSFSVPTLDDSKAEDEERVAIYLSNPQGAQLGFQSRAILLVVDDEVADPTLLDDFEGFHRFHEQQGTVTLSTLEVAAGEPLALPGQVGYEQILRVDYDATGGPASFYRHFPISQDWTTQQGVRFWFNGTGSGDTLAMDVLANQAPTTGTMDPSQWVLQWSDEFDGANGALPNPNVWTHELGDGALNGIVGWGNSELQYYTDRPENGAMDGQGNLRITVREADPADNFQCWYGPCEYTSARLITANKVEQQYGRIEARIQVPQGTGLWPAFWMLGSDIAEVGWPQTGEIDIMEVVGREPYEVFGTIHGPGYSGGESFGDTYTMAQPVHESFHTFAVEWEPGEIRWYVDNILYHTATPADVAPNDWVFDHPFFLILNVAIGGNFGGPVGNDVVLPQTMTVDYVRLYGAPDTAERYRATFTDDVAGWREVVLPFSAFAPETAAAGTLVPSDVWGYGFHLAEGAGTFYLDQTELTATIPTAVTMGRLDAIGQRGSALPWLAFGVVVAGLGLAHYRRVRSAPR